MEKYHLGSCHACIAFLAAASMYSMMLNDILHTCHSSHCHVHGCSSRNNEGVCWDCWHDDMQRDGLKLLHAHCESFACMSSFTHGSSVKLLYHLEHMFHILYIFDICPRLDVEKTC